MNFNPEEFIDLVNRSTKLSNVPTSNGAYSTVEESKESPYKSKKTTFFDLHTDGMYLTEPPRFAILYCLHPGRGDTPTFLVDSATALKKMKQSSKTEFSTLQQLDVIFIGKGPKEYTRPFIEPHPQFQEYVTNMTTNGYIRPRVIGDDMYSLPSIRDQIAAMSSCYRYLDETLILKHFWKENDLLIFDNYQYLHGRTGDIPDEKRRLIRMWVDVR